jgi:hypothetical protein
VGTNDDLTESQKARMGQGGQFGKKISKRVSKLSGGISMSSSSIDSSEYSDDR